MDFKKGAVCASLACLISACGGGGGSVKAPESSTDGTSQTSSTGTPIYLSLVAQSLTEASAGQTKQVTLKLNQTSTQDVSVQYAFIDGTASIADDLRATDGIAIIPAGSTTTTIDFSVFDDAIDENDESFKLRFTNPVNASLTPDELNSADLEISILDNDVDPTVSFYPKYQLVSENNTSSVIKLQLSHASSREAQVKINISGTAQEGQDFEMQQDYSTLNILPGVTEYDIQINVKQDSIPEYGEVIYLTLADPVFLKLEDDPVHTSAITDLSAMNDTGRSTFYDGATHSSLNPVADYPGQDADHGYDADPEEGDENGDRGFSFTKIDHDGNPLPHSANNYVCIKDNRTGLVWERKQPNDDYPYQFNSDRDVQEYIESFPSSDPYDPTRDYGLVYWRAQNFKYYWRETDATNNSGSVGVDLASIQRLPGIHPSMNTCGYPYEAGASLGSESNRCTTIAYVNAMNYYGVCGFKDWKLPSAPQLRSIVHYGEQQEQSANPVDDYFFDNNWISGEYLTATPDVNNTSSAWCMDMETGQTKLCKKNNTHYVRAVRQGN